MIEAGLIPYYLLARLILLLVLDLLVFSPPLEMKINLLGFLLDHRQ
jgi:hypothetical protein